MSNTTIYTGDCRDILAMFYEDNHFDSIVTDPPYGLEFMGKAWDAPWKQTSGGFSSPGIGERATEWPSYKGTNRTRCASCGMLVGQGGSPCKCDNPRPVNSDAVRMRAFQAWCEGWAREAFRVLKPGGHLLAFSGTRTYHRMVCAIEDAGFEIRDQIGWVYGSGFPKSHNGEWGGTALKPAWEPIVMARKPLIGTVEANWLAFGTGALHIDACRVATDENLNGGAYAKTGGRGESQSLHGGSGMNQPGKTVGTEFVQPEGRWPANIIHDGSDEVLAAFPQAPGQLAAESFTAPSSKTRNTYGERGRRPGGFGNVGAEKGSPVPNGPMYGDKGSAARFFYCAKASKKDRGDYNNHPTVKPTELMRYLLRLVTPPGGKALDLFVGSGSTGKAAALEGFEFVGIDLSAEYVTIAERRIAEAA